MRSPLGARFPPYVGALGVAFVLSACPSEGTSTEEATSPTPTSGVGETVGPGSGSGTGGANEGDRVRTARVSDRDSRRTIRGEAPAYVEVEGASVRGAVDALRFRLELAGPVPTRMPDRRSVLRVTFMVTTADGRRYSFEAQCIRPGWGTFAAGGPEEAPIPELTITGRRLELAVDPAYVGGLQPFEWLANVAWTSGEANYAFDAAPKQGYARFP